MRKPESFMAFYTIFLSDMAREPAIITFTAPPVCHSDKFLGVIRMHRNSLSRRLAPGFIQFSFCLTFCKFTSTVIMLMFAHLFRRFQTGEESFNLMRT